MMSATGLLHMIFQLQMLHLSLVNTQSNLTTTDVSSVNGTYLNVTAMDKTSTYLDTTLIESIKPTSEPTTEYTTAPETSSQGESISSTDNGMRSSGSSMNMDVESQQRTTSKSIRYSTEDDYGPVGLPPRSMSDEERLLKYLLDRYNPSARPVMHGSDTVNVKMQFSLMHIKDLDVKSQILTTTGLLILEWTDERLTWEPTEHNNLTEVIVEIAVLWKPEFAVINGAEDIYEEYNQFRAVVSHEGVVHWEPGGVFKTMCGIDITYYPFDDQLCNLKFGAWTYHTAKMNMSNMSDTVNTDSYSENGEWTIITSHVRRSEFFYVKAPNEFFAFVDFTVYLRRRHLFYILNVILPSIMTSVLLLSVFFCTPAQKVQIGVVVLLSFRIFLLNVADNIPKTSDHIPLLSIYLTCTMAITTLSMVLTVLVLNLHHISDRPIPGWARSVLFTGTARIMGMCSTADALAQKPKPQVRKQQTYMNSIFHRSGAMQDSDCSEEKAAMMLDSREVHGHIHGITIDSNGDGGGPCMGQQTMGGRAGGMSHETYMRKLRLQKEEEMIKEKEKLHDYANDWKKIAEIFDRLFFWFFLFAIFFSTLVLFHPLIEKKPIDLNALIESYE